MEKYNLIRDKVNIFFYVIYDFIQLYVIGKGYLKGQFKVIEKFLRNVCSNILKLEFLYNRVIVVFLEESICELCIILILKEREENWVYQSVLSCIFFLFEEESCEICLFFFVLIFLYYQKVDDVFVNL